MAKTVQQESGSQKLALKTKHSKTLEELREKRQSLGKDLYEGLERTEEIYRSMDEAGLKEVDKNLSKLDSGLNRCNEFNQTIAELASGLTGELTSYVQFAAKGKNYQGFEKFVSIFSKDSANSMRVKRLKNQTPRENLKQIIDYADQLFEEICSVREDSLNTFSRLQANVDVITEKLAEYEPREEALKEKLDAMEKLHQEKEEKLKSASPGEQAELQAEINELRKELTDVRHEYDQTFTIYNQAQQALDANKQSRDAFEKMVRDLGRQATMIKEKIDNVTEIYLAAPEAVKVMMTTKGMESMDKAINVATDQSVDIITQSAESVSDATLKREEIQLIDEKVMRGYMDRMENTMKDFNERYDAIRDKAQRSAEERYAD